MADQTQDADDYPGFDPAVIDALVAALGPRSERSPEEERQFVLACLEHTGVQPEDVVIVAEDPADWREGIEIVPKPDVLEDAEDLSVYSEFCSQALRRRRGWSPAEVESLQGDAEIVDAFLTEIEAPR